MTKKYITQSTALALILMISCACDESASAKRSGGEAAGSIAAGSQDAGDAAGATAGLEGGQGGLWVPDAGASAGEPVAGSAGAQAGAQAGAEAGVSAELRLDLSLTSPEEGSVHPLGRAIEVSGAISASSDSLDFVAAELRLDGAAPLPLSFNRDTGAISARLESPSEGEHELSLKASVAPQTIETLTRRFSVSCETLNDFDQPLNPERWVTFEPAVHDSRGWLELTQNQLNVRGGIFWVGGLIQPGDLDVEFRFSTSKCEEPGACDLNRINAGGGFSVNFWDTSAANISALWDVTRGLGNVTPLELLMGAGVPRLDSFHVTFDTYSNYCGPCNSDSGYDGCGNGHYDPSTENFVALYFNGHKAVHGEPDEAGSYCHLGAVGEDFAERWAPYPQLDDGVWHKAHIVIQGTRIQVSVDEQLLIDTEVPSLNFKGGLLSFAAGSGVNGNYHRIDQLRVNQLCQ